MSVKLMPCRLERTVPGRPAALRPLMRILVFLLVLANLLFFAYTEGYFGHPENPDALRAEQQVRPEQVKVVSHGAAPAEGGASAPGAVPEAAPVAPAEAQTLPAGTADPATICLHWSGMAAVEADRLSALLAGKFDAFRQNRRQLVPDGGTWWVFIPPQASKADADRKAAELRRLGVGDYFVIQEQGPNHLAISLGVFSAEAGAQGRLAELRAQGVKSARHGPRSGKEAQHSLDAIGPAESREALLGAVAAELPELKSQACP